MSGRGETDCFYFQNLDAATVLSEAAVHPSSSATLVSCYTNNYTLSGSYSYNLTSVGFRLKRLGTLSDAYFACGIWGQDDQYPNATLPFLSSTARLGDTFGVALELAIFDFPGGFIVEPNINYAYGLYCVNGTVSISPVHYIQLVYTSGTQDTTCGRYVNSAWTNYTVMDLGFALFGLPIVEAEAAEVDNTVWLWFLVGCMGVGLIVLGVIRR